MAQFIESVLSQVKAEVARVLSPEVIKGICRELNYVWRNRTLDPVTTVYAFLRQILEGNTACDHVPHLTGLPVTGEAYCKARARLPVELFRRLLLRVSEAVGGACDDSELWHGHRLWHLDGSTCSMPDTPELQDTYGQPGSQAAGCGFPVAHLMTLFHATTGCLLRIVAAPLRTHDMSQAERVHDLLKPNDVLIGDRGFCSFVHLALLLSRGVFAVFRLHQKTIVSFRRGRDYVGSPRDKTSRRRRQGGPKKGRGGAKRTPPKPYSRWVRWLGKCDQVVEYFKPQQRPRWMTPEAYALLPDSIQVRELRYRVRRRGYRVREVVLVTTLLDPERYPADELARLYQDRWQIETNLRHLKQTLKMDVLRTKTAEGIEKELAMYAIVYNLIRMTMLQSAERRHLPVTRISFIDTQRRLKHSLSGQPLRELIILPDRPGRFEPRVRKRRPKSYKLMRKPRRKLKQDLARGKLKA